MVTACAVAHPGGYGDGGNDIRRKQPQHQDQGWTSDHHGSPKRFGQGSSEHGSFYSGEPGHGIAHHGSHGEPQHGSFGQKVTHDIILGGQHDNGFRQGGGGSPQHGGQRPQSGHGSSGFIDKNFGSNYGGSQQHGSTQQHGDGGYHGGSSHGPEHGGSHYDHQHYHEHEHDHGHGHGWSGDSKKHGGNRGEKSTDLLLEYGVLIKNFYYFQVIKICGLIFFI